MTSPPHPDSLRSDGDNSADQRAELAEQFRRQAEWCKRLGSDLYARLLTEAAADAGRGGLVWRALSAHLPAPQMEVMLPLRFMAAVHTLVLRGDAPALEPFYPSVGGGAVRGDEWPAFAATLGHHLAEVRKLSGAPVQTNEVGRCAALIGGFLRVAAETRKPLRLLEVGCSAGLNLRWDRYRYESPRGSWGPAGSPVRLIWDDPPAHLDAPIVIAGRSGCDLVPLDPAQQSDRIRLLSAVWPDQLDRIERLRAALSAAASLPVELETGSVSDVAPRWLGRPTRGVATVIFHSVVLQYLTDEQRTTFLQVLEAAGERATSEAPLAHLTLEPSDEVLPFAVCLRTWPGGDEVVLASSGPHGSDIAWK